MRGIEPGDPATPAIAGDADALRITAIAADKSGEGIEITHHLRVRHLGDDLGKELLEIGDLGRVALPLIKIRRDGVIACLGKATDDVADPFMNPENFLHDDDHRQVLPSLGLGAIGAHLDAARRKADHAGIQPIGGGRNGRGGQRLGRQRIAGRNNGSGQSLPAGHACVRDPALIRGKGHVLIICHRESPLTSC